MAVASVATPLDVILTGIPRSGLTLAGAFIDSFDNAVCLNEQYNHTAVTPSLAGQPQELVKWVVGEFFQQRNNILQHFPIPDIRAQDGAHLHDSIFDPRNPATDHENERKVVLSTWSVREDFTLAIKHHALYAALLPLLVQLGHFKVIAVVRNPVDVILSWQKLKGHRLASGLLPDEIYSLWPKAHEVAMATNDKLTRMVQLYDLFCEQFYLVRDCISIVKYENMVSNPSVISEAVGRSGVPPVCSEIHLRKVSVQLGSGVEPIRARLRENGVFYKHFYPIV